MSDRDSRFPSPRGFGFRVSARAKLLSFPRCCHGSRPFEHEKTLTSDEMLVIVAQLQSWGSSPHSPRVRGDIALIL